MTVISVYWILLILCISSNGFTFSGGWRRMGSFQSLLSASSKTNLINEGENGKIGNHNCFLPDNKEKESGYSTHFSFDRDKSPDLPPPSAMPMKAISECYIHFLTVLLNKFTISFYRWKLVASLINIKSCQSHQS